MDNIDVKALQEELKQFQKEKEQIRNLVGQIGGKKYSDIDKAINIIFILTVVILFIIDTLIYIFNVYTPLPKTFLISIGLLLVSLKIIWMIHKQAKVDHFQFWILNSIEYRLNDISKKINNITDKL